MTRRSTPASFAAGAALLLSTTALAGPPPEARQARSEPDVATPVQWLIAAQHESGGWGPETRSPPDVATTALSGIALIRLGHTPGAGAHQGATRRAVAYVVRAIEATPPEEIDVNPPGTLPQRKLGRHIDTFLAVQLLAEALPGYPQGAERERVKRALDAGVAKTARAQRQDGSFSADGWAPVLSSAFASTGLHAARAAGATVSGDLLARGDRYMLDNYDTKEKRFKTGSSAGVELYTMAGTAQAAARAGAMSGEAAKAAMARLSDENFIRGFGTYGGEEHVSYMMTSEALASIGGKEWERWDHGIRLRLAHIQRQDGTWKGDHCITSTAFCTAASLITLTIQPRKAPSKLT